MCKKPPKRRKVGDTLTAIPEGAAAATYQWLANGVEIPGATDATLKVKEDYIGQQISVTVTAEDGEEATSELTAPVTTDMSAEIKLIDEDGLQPDGTALNTDNLVISYGADLGTPSIIIWYCNGAAKTVYSLAGGGIDATAFESDTIRANMTGLVLPAGDWWVTIENTAGDVAVTNVITVASDEVAIMSDVSFEDAYGDSATADIITATPAEVIINVTFNKDYTGTLYLNEVSNDKYEDTEMIGTAATREITLPGDLTKQTKASKFTNKYALGTAGKGIRYVESDGTMHAKIVVPGAVTRGKDYELIFDQDDIIGDELGAKVEKEDLNVSTPATVPYVNAPDSIKVTKFFNGTETPEVTFYDANDEAMDWWGNGASIALGGFESVKVFGVDTNAKSADDKGVAPATANIKDGVVTLDMGTGNGIGKKYAYVKMKTTEGIFAEKTATLESEISETAIAALDSISLKEDDKTPENAVVTIKGLSSKAPGTVYILQGETSDTGADDAATFANIAVKDTKKAIKSAKVDGATTEVKFEDVFSAKQMATAGHAANNDKFVAVYVPDDQELWLSKAGLNDDGEGFTLAPVIKGVDKENMATELTAVKDATAESGLGKADGKPSQIEVTLTGIQLLDQFGNRWAGTPSADPYAVAVSTTKNMEDHSESGSGTVTYTAVGLVTLAATIESTGSQTTPDKVFDKGEKFTFTVAKLAGLSVSIETKHKITTDEDVKIVVDGDDAGGNNINIAVNATDLSKAFSVG